MSKNIKVLFFGVCNENNKKKIKKNKKINKMNK